MHGLFFLKSAAEEIGAENVDPVGRHWFGHHQNVAGKYGDARGRRTISFFHLFILSYL